MAKKWLRPLDRGLIYYSFLQLFQDFEYWPLNRGWPLHYINCKREATKLVPTRLCSVSETAYYYATFQAVCISRVSSSIRYSLQHPCTNHAVEEFGVRWCRDFSFYSPVWLGSDIVFFQNPQIYTQLKIFENTGKFILQGLDSYNTQDCFFMAFRLAADTSLRTVEPTNQAITMNSGLKSVRIGLGTLCVLAAIASLLFSFI